ncbi:MAG: hypothetical protein ABJ239_06435 [Erythrobacter sp.]
MTKHRANGLVKSLFLLLVGLFVVSYLWALYAMPPKLDAKPTATVMGRLAPESKDCQISYDSETEFGSLDQELRASVSIAIGYSSRHIYSEVASNKFKSLDPMSRISTSLFGYSEQSVKDIDAEFFSIVEKHAELKFLASLAQNCTIERNRI